MAPRVNCNPGKLTNILSYLQKSRTAHNIKDLEKHLPSVASINGMQVKDYLQSLQDENRINVEKIGSGNWYWSFVSQDQKIKQKTLEDARSNYDKVNTIVKDLRHKLAETAAAREDEEAMLDNSGPSRDELMDRKTVTHEDLKSLRKELEAYRDNDPTELERKKVESKKWMEEAEQATDDLWAMEGWFAKQGTKEDLNVIRMGYYNDEWDSEACDFRDII